MMTTHEFLALLDAAIGVYREEFGTEEFGEETENKDNWSDLYHAIGACFAKLGVKP